MTSRGRRCASSTATQRLIYDGLWFSPLRDALDAFVESSQRHVTGEVRLRLEPNRCYVIGRRAPRSLYDYGLATYDAADRFRHADSEGFRPDLGPRRADLVGGAGAGVEQLSTDDRQQLWHGRFESGPAAELVEFTESLSYDQRLHLRRPRLLPAPTCGGSVEVGCSTTTSWR